MNLFVCGGDGFKNEWGYFHAPSADKFLGIPLWDAFSKISCQQLIKLWWSEFARSKKYWALI